MSRGGEQIKVSEIAGLIDQIQAGGSEEFAILCLPQKFLAIANSRGFSYKDMSWNVSSIDFSSLRKMVFTDIKAPEGIETFDVSFYEDNSVVIWAEDTTLYVSSQKEGKKIYFIKANSSYSGYEGYSYFQYESYWDDRLETSQMSCGFTELDLKNLYPLTNNFYNFFNECRNVKKIDISHWKIKVDSARNMFCYCQNLEELDISGFDMSDLMEGRNIQYMFSNAGQFTTSMKIYAQEWKDQFKFSDKSEKLFNNMTWLPDYDSNKVDLNYCCWKENGGYFTNPAEREN